MKMSTLNYLKKLEQHENQDYLGAPSVIGPASYNDLPFIQEYHFYEGQITPDTMIQNREAYEITEIHHFLIIKGLSVHLENNKVKRVEIYGIHPNKDPETNLYCLPNHKLNVEFTDEYVRKLVRNIKIYYLDNCFFQPPSKYVTYKRLKSMSIQLNEGE